jgi:DNA primase
MAGRIPENKIDEVRTAADIVEIISGYVTLKKRGRNFLGLCPFHDEKTPSFSVSPEKQIFHCFGCGKGGNVFTFLMEHEKFSFIEAIKSLADRYGIILPRYEKRDDSRTERMLYANSVAATYFQSNLKNKKYRDRIESYLYDKRGLTPDIVEKFQLGLATDDWHSLEQYAEKKDLKPQELAEAGLIIKSDKTGEYYDRFRMRLMIPIYNLGGKIVGFGGRTLKKGETIKYMNSPETPVYNKSFILYGMNFAKTAIRDAGSAILVEGYFDFLSLYQAGIENVVAVSGTSFTPQQAKLLGRFAQKAYLFFDADSAGRNAALRSVEYFFNAGIDPIIVDQPPGQDPDSFVREHGPEAVHKLLAEGVTYLSFRFDKFDPTALTSREKEQVVRETRSLAAKIDDPLRREIFVAAAAERLKLPATAFRLEPGKAKKDGRIPERVRNTNVLESEFLSLFVTRPALIEIVWNDIAPDDLQGPGHRALYTLMIEAYRAGGEIIPDKLIESIDDETEKSGLAFISTLDWGDLDLAGVVKEYKQMILNQKRERQITALREQLAEAEKKKDRDLAQKLTGEIKYLLEKRG